MSSYKYVAHDLAQKNHNRHVNTEKLQEDDDETCTQTYYKNRLHHMDEDVGMTSKASFNYVQRRQRRPQQLLFQLRLAPPPTTTTTVLGTRTVRPRSLNIRLLEIILQIEKEDVS